MSFEEVFVDHTIHYAAGKFPSRNTAAGHEYQKA